MGRCGGGQGAYQRERWNDSNDTYETCTVLEQKVCRDDGKMFNCHLDENDDTLYKLGTLGVLPSWIWLMGN